jgi:methylated-DNA-[protein]-cysteine S-methyltransferase
MLFCTSFNSRIGVIYIASSEDGLCKISISRGSRGEFISWIKSNFNEDEVVESWDVNREVIKQLSLYFTRRLRKFNLRLDLIGTKFQRRVWRELMKIPYGRTVTYGDIARMIGKPGASRAVGRALAENPIPIIVPCHRVIASDGSPGGYSFGVEIKEFLLGLEGARNV